MGWPDREPKAEPLPPLDGDKGGFDPVALSRYLREQVGPLLDEFEKLRTNSSGTKNRFYRNPFRLPIRDRNRFTKRYSEETF